MRVSSAIRAGSESLATISNLPGSPTKIARILFCSHLDVSLEWIFLNADLDIDTGTYFDLINEFKSGVPLEYLTGMVSFYSRDFHILRGVLIPRPETELLVDVALDLIKEQENPKICEIGVGSGIISIMIALFRPDSKIIATDISQKAIENTLINLNKFGVKIDLKKTNLMDGICGDFDLLISNPPYIASNYKLDKWVLSEPASALFGGKNGDEILHDIIILAKERNIPKIACEIGYDQKNSMDILLKQSGYESKFYKDLSGKYRGFCAKLK